MFGERPLLGSSGSHVLEGPVTTYLPVRWELLLISGSGFQPLFRLARYGSWLNRLEDTVSPR